MVSHWLSSCQARRGRWGLLLSWGVRAPPSGLPTLQICESWAIKKLSTELLTLLNCGAGVLLRVPWTTRSNQSILKEINPEYSLEGLKLQNFGHLMQSRLTGKDPDARKDSRQEEKGMTEGEMVGWHHRLNGHEFEQTPRHSEGQGSLACCSPWGHKESDMTE